MGDKFAFDVFLSYTRGDERRVRSLAERLRDSGLRVWFDQWAIKPGQDIHWRIDEGLTSSRTMVSCISAAALKADWFRRESSAVMFRDPTNQARRFVPLLLNDCDVPESIRPFRYIDFRRSTSAAFSELLAACSPLSPADNSVRPLHVVEDRFLQVLLYQFSLRRRSESRSRGVELRVCFNDETPTIWSQHGKRYLRDRLSKEERTKYQDAFDKFLIKKQGASYEFSDALFPFRYASGGTLPVITLTTSRRSKSYYCLFYRDVHPIGWNIANGGCDTRAELMNPEDTIERELKEELIIADFSNDVRYVFSVDRFKPFDHPAHSVVRRLWAVKCPTKNLNVLDVKEVPVKPAKGPDALHVQFGSDRPSRRDGLYVNINGEDFGIEFDRLAKITLPDSVTLFDGEIDGEHLVNSPVGLFDIATFNRRLRSREPQFFKPDIFFFDAERRPGGQIDEVLRGPFLKHVAQFRTREEVDELRAAIKAGRQYALCPVTSRIVRRVVDDERRGAKRV